VYRVVYSGLAHSTGILALVDSEFLSSEEVLEELLKRPALRQVAATCVLPAVRCGLEWRYRRADLDAWLEQQQRAGILSREKALP